MDAYFNPDKQHTLSSSILISGTGIHSGARVTMNLVPSLPNTGYRFQRIDLPGAPIIEADCDFVIDTFRCTTLAQHGATISAVEHILAALAGMGVDNCLIEVDGGEIPTVDGSCGPFAQEIERAGLREQQALKIWHSLDTCITYLDKQKQVKMAAFPCAEFRINTMIDFRNGSLQPQLAELIRMKDFKEQIAPSRTYCLLREMEMLLDNNLIKGDIVHHALLVVDGTMSREEFFRITTKFGLKNAKEDPKGYLNNVDLRFENEIARHKLMDTLGDLALIGYPVKTHILAHRPGHSSNVALARMIKKYIREKEQSKFRKVA
ncbi:MAG: UDP-3-O-acyl-N-acetylglucosamine deacetylase [Chitinophagales bacterium]